MPDADLKSVAVSFGVQVAVAAGILAAFSVLRPTQKRVYEPRLELLKDPQRRPDPIHSRNPTSWISLALRTDERRLVHKIGLDSVMFLAFLRLCGRFFAMSAIVSVPLMIFNYYAPRITGLPGFSVDDTISGNITTSAASNSSNPLDKIPNPQLVTLSLQNLNPDARNWFWLYVALAYIYTIVGFYLIYTTWTTYVEFRREWFQSDQFRKADNQRTLLLTNVPEALIADDALIGFVSRLGLQQAPRQAIVGRKVEILPDLVLEHQRLMSLLEVAVCRNLKLAEANKPPKDPYHFEGGLFNIGILGGHRVKTIEYCQKRLQELEEEIYEIRSLGDTAFKEDASGFILFDTAVGAHSCARRYRVPAAITVRTGLVNPPSLKVSPHFDDIIWENIGLNGVARRSRQLTAIGITIALILLWTVIVGFVSTTTSLESLSRRFPALSDYVASHEWVNVFFKAFVAPAVLVGLNIALHYGLGFLAYFQGVSSNTGKQKSVLHKFFAFQVYQVVFLVALSSLVTAVTSFVGGSDDALSAYTWETALKAASMGFITSSTYYIVLIAAGFPGYATEIIQAARLIMGYIKRLTLRNTPRSEEEFNKLPTFSCTFVYSNLLLVFLLGSAYCIVAPLATIFAWVLFFLAYLVMRYQLTYVYETQNETGGTWWPKVFNLLSICFGFWQLVTFICFSFVTNASTLTDGVAITRAQNIMLGILPIFTALFWFAIWKYVAPRAAFVSEDNMVLQDYHRQQTANEEGDIVLSDRVFNPALTKPLWTLTLFPQHQQQASQYYEPRYKDLYDYIRKKKGGKGFENTREGKIAKARLVNLPQIPGHGRHGSNGQPLSPQQQRRPSNSAASPRGLQQSSSVSGPGGPRPVQHQRQPSNGIASNPSHAPSQHLRQPSGNTDASSGFGVQQQRQPSSQSRRPSGPRPPTSANPRSPGAHEQYEMSSRRDDASRRQPAPPTHARSPSSGRNQPEDPRLVSRADSRSNLI